jgi:oligopeptide/dipeptide ABC transporter ATP-binding protein
VEDEPLLDVKDLTVHFPIGKRILQAVTSISFKIFPGETLGLVGESGSGKSTTGRAILRLEPRAKGEVFFRNQPLFEMPKQELKAFRKSAQMIFQDPYASLNPRMSAKEIIAEPLDIHGLEHGAEREKRLKELIELVGLSPHHLSRFPHEFSGGQRQRLGIARAIAARPQFLVCDEPISALDVSVQAQIINLLKKFQEEMGLSYLFITHDLRVVKYLSHRIAVIYLGHIVELATSEDLFANPLHPYTQALLSAIPIPDPIQERKRTRIFLKDEPPSPFNPPQGCVFSSRCPYAKEICFLKRPELRTVAPGHEAACHLLTPE